MFKKILLLLMVCAGLAASSVMEKAIAGNYAVGTVYDYTQFGVQARYGVTGYIILEVNGPLPMGGAEWLYHTQTNHSRFGSETIATYRSNGRIGLWLYTWIPDGTGAYPNDVDFNAYDNLLGQDITNSYNRQYKTYLVGLGDGNIDSSFQKYTTNGTLEGESKKVVRFENVSEWNPNGTWREVTKLYNYNTSSWDVVMDITWTASKEANYSSGSGQGYWAGAVETFANNFASWNGKEIGSYGMCFIGSSGLFSSMQSPWCTLKTSNSATGMTVVNSNPIPSYWLGRKQ